MVAAAKLRRAQEAAEASRPYALKMNEMIKNLSAGVDESSSPLFRKSPVPSRILVVVISSDRGLCGGYNSNLFRATNKFIRSREHQGITVDVMPIGRKAKQHYKPGEFSLWKGEVPTIVGHVNFKVVNDLSLEITGEFLDGDYDEIYIAFNEFVSAIQYNQRIEPMLPLSPEEAEEDALAVSAPEAFPNGQLKEYTFEPNKQSLLATLLPKSLSIQLLTSFYEAEASEHSARMTAMDNATTNATEMISSLTLEYNRARQAYITRELVEIVSGAEALHG